MIYLYLLQHRTNLDNLPQDKKWSFYDLVTNWPAILPVTRKMHLNPAHLSGWLQRLTGSQQVTARCGCGISGSEFWMSERWCRTNPSVRPVCWPAGISGPSFGCSIVVLTPSRPTEAQGSATVWICVSTCRCSLRHRSDTVGTLNCLQNYP